GITAHCRMQWHPAVSRLRWESDSDLGSTRGSCLCPPYPIDPPTTALHGILTRVLERARRGTLVPSGGRADPGPARRRAPEAPHGTGTDHLNGRLRPDRRWRLRVCTAADRELRRGLGRRQDALLAVGGRTRSRDMP